MNDTGDDRVEYEIYYNENEEPIALSLGQFGERKVYNSIGQEVECTYLDKNYKPFVTSKGYTKVIRSFYPDGNAYSLQYYDKNNEPIKLFEGQYGIKKEDDKIIFLDINGNEFHSLLNMYLYHGYYVVLISLVMIVLSCLINRKRNIILLCLYIGVSLYITLFLNRNSKNTQFKFELFWSYANFFTNSTIRIEILKNIWLFVPIGAILYNIYPKAIVLLLPIIISTIIEVMQLIAGLGLCEIDDVISNGIGGCFGFTMCKLTSGFLQRIKSWRHI